MPFGPLRVGKGAKVQKATGYLLASWEFLLDPPPLDRGVEPSQA
jgi:hypothetical protein